MVSPNNTLNAAAIDHSHGQSFPPQAVITTVRIICNRLNVPIAYDYGRHLFMMKATAEMGLVPLRAALRNLTRAGGGNAPLIPILHKGRDGNVRFSLMDPNSPARRDLMANFGPPQPPPPADDV